MKTWQSVLLGFIGGIIAATIIFILAAQPSGIPVQLSAQPTPVPIKVFITGAITKPGVYSIAPDKRIDDLVGLAGGFTNSANQNAINLAAELKDGEKIVIPDQKLVSTLVVDNFQITPTTSVVFPININTATQRELDALPSIGETKAMAIINYREKNGFFSKIEDIQKVPGIGLPVFKQIKDLITVQ
jgi:competence protein ComEA